ncbi:helix-turn-helix domain-containing protein [Streptomyces sp. NBC_00120]|uniref:helix-turn-helix domain-containing protein n=1 Tax=Streptomyces sp. NBC_00120 TaxID=2975660 RepID=UPI002254D6BC|nr:helix-turn-helix transcriptional regulator [Streptomyces sp. NBC_00120]MCX5326369.1 helix-turn-helix transcriptional regulator [Streptomyces sp. NBC_00120]
MATTLRFCADVLTKKAEAVGDTTHYAIAQRAGVRESTISRLVAGRTVPTVATLFALADAYGIDIDHLVTGRVPRPADTVPAPRDCGERVPA